MAVTIGNGDLSLGGAVVETSGGTKYAIFVDAFVEVWKDIDGISSQVGTWNPTGNPGYVHAAIDSAGLIHIAVANLIATAGIKYRQFDTSDDLWEIAEEAAAAYADGKPTNVGCSISIDSSDIPHILYMDCVKYHGTPEDQVYHAWDDGGWDTELVCGAPAGSYLGLHLTCCPGDDLEAIYGAVGVNYVTYRRKNVDWGTEYSYTTDADETIGNVVCTTGDIVYRFYADGQSIEENDADTGYDTDSVQKRVSAALVGTDRYIFYIDTSDDVHLIKNLGASWVDEGAQQTGTFLYVIAEWAYNNEHQSGEINYIFDDGTDVFYGSFSLGPPPVGQPMIIRTRGIPTGPGSRIGGSGWN